MFAQEILINYVARKTKLFLKISGENLSSA